MIWIFFFSCLVPTLVEAFLDRHGEYKKGKRKDLLWTVVAAIAIAGSALWLGYRPLPVIGLIIGWRVLVFDYLVTWLLIRNDVINPNTKWWDYTGSTTYFWDQWVARVPWRLRLALRALIFAVALIYFLR